MCKARGKGKRHFINMDSWLRDAQGGKLNGANFKFKQKGEKKCYAKQLFVVVIWCGVVWCGVVWCGVVVRGGGGKGEA